MTTSTAEQQRRPLVAFTSQAALTPPTAGPDWLQASRTAAAARFAQLGLPSAKHEDWRFTNITPIRDTKFITAADSPSLSPDQVRAVAIPGLETTRLVFVNGWFNPALSTLGTLPRGVKVMSLAQAIETQPALLQKHLGQLADSQGHAFTALNSAAAQDGVFVHVPQGQTITQPIYLLNVTTSQQPLLTNARNVVVVDQGASAAVVEDYVSLGQDVYLTNAVTELFVADQAHATHYLIERESPHAYNVTTLYARQGHDSRLASHAILFGGAIVRNNVYPVLDGERCDSLLNGLYVIGGRQLVDNHMRVEHAQPHCGSRQFYKGVIKDGASGVFRGRIVVRPGAQKTDAKQSNQTLLLSDRASVNSDPQLEIYADDVKCTHGATIGQIDPDQVFFLRSRGIPKETAHAMVVYAFASESLERIEHQPLKDFAKSALLDHLPAGRVLRQTL